jgi:hypothetical protein
MPTGTRVPVGPLSLALAQATEDVTQHRQPMLFVHDQIRGNLAVSA